VAGKGPKKTGLSEAEFNKRVAALDQQAADLAAFKDDLESRQLEIDTELAKVLDRAKALDKREAALNAQQTAIEEMALIEADQGLSEEEKDLIAEGCQALGIPAEFVFDSNVDRLTGEAVILTHGGARVRWRPGATVEPLPEIKVTGINPKKRKPIVGKARDTKE
jgi:hypothetical protein